MPKISNNNCPSNILMSIISKSINNQSIILKEIEEQNIQIINNEQISLTTNTTIETMYPEILENIFSFADKVDRIVLLFTCKKLNSIVTKCWTNTITKEKFTNKVAYKGYLNLLIWAQEIDCQINHDTCWNASYGGQIEILKWLRAYGCKLNKSICSAAAKGGHLNVLKWLRENGC